MISRAVSAPSAHHADPDVDRPSGYAHGCAQITRFGTASGDRHSDLVAEHIGGSARVLSGLSPSLSVMPVVDAACSVVESYGA